MVRTGKSSYQTDEKDPDDAIPAKRGADLYSKTLPPRPDGVSG